MPQNRTIPKPWDVHYRIARILLGIAFIAAGVAFAFVILFPSQSLSFDFKNPGASKNTLLDPHAPDGTTLEKGNVPSKTPIIIDASLVRGDYSLLQAIFTPDKKSPLPQGSATIKKSYRAFFLPEGAPVADMDASKEKFRSGSLLSFADGVFLIDGNQVRPVGDATIFENLGYSWEDVVPASEEDMGAYEKGKMVVLGNMHPDGTVFLDTDLDTYYLVRDHEKHRFADKAVAESYLHGAHPILVSGKSLTVEQSCDLPLKGLLIRYYECSTPIDALKDLPGDSYRISARFDDAVSLESAETVFSDRISFVNMKTSLSQIKQRILSHYGYGQ